MKQENLPPSWVLGAHFSRAVYHRIDACIDTSQLDIHACVDTLQLDIPWNAIGKQSEPSLDDSECAERGPVCLRSEASLDVLYEQAPQPLPENVDQDGPDDNQGHSFSFPSTIPLTIRACDSPQWNFMKDTPCLISSAADGDLIGTLSLSAAPNVLNKHSATIDVSVSTARFKRSSYHDIVFGLQDDTQTSSPKILSPGKNPSKSLLWGFPDFSTTGKPRNCQNNPQEDSTQCTTKSTGPWNETSQSVDNSDKEASGAIPVKRDIIRALSWSDHLANGSGNEKAVLSAENWMLDLSQLFLGERFASGAHSRIYHGIYCEIPVAVKIIRQPEEDDCIADHLEKIFMQEVNSLSCLQHQNVVRFMAACKKPPVLCVVTEYLEGGSLRAFLRKREGEVLAVPQVIRMALDISYGMEYVHMKGVIHRDLKSENLVLDRDGRIKILDFGVSRFDSACNYDLHDLGTYRWMAPEMLSKKPYTRKVDVYSFGIVLWELLTTHLPYEAMGAVQAAFCVIHENTRPPIPTNCPAFLRDLLHQCWSAEPDDRPEFWEILKVLNKWVDS